MAAVPAPADLWAPQDRHPQGWAELRRSPETRIHSGDNNPSLSFPSGVNVHRWLDPVTLPFSGRRLGAYSKIHQVFISKWSQKMAKHQWTCASFCLLSFQECFSNRVTSEAGTRRPALTILCKDAPRPRPKSRFFSASAERLVLT